MESWVYIFSRFTQEALLFEALLIFIGFAAYAAFYITRRRKYGAADQEIPSNLVKVYLAQLVADAEEMRNQLFGLLGKGQADGKLFNIHLIQSALNGETTTTTQPIAPPAGASADSKWAATPATAASSDPLVQQKLKEVEAKMQEQAKALDAVLNEKMRLEEELAVAKKKSTGAPAGASAAADDGLSDRVKTLEAQLAEYAVIEDDLANLKRLQKENKQLRTQLESLQTSTGQSAGSVPAAVAEESVGPLPPKAEEPNVSGTMERAATPETQVDLGAPAEQPTTRIEAAQPVAVEGPAGPTESAPAPPAAAEAAPASPSGDPAESEFDALVDDVEKSLAADPAPAAPAAEATAEKAPGDPSEEELQADFEKMLKS